MATEEVDAALLVAKVNQKFELVDDSNKYPLPDDVQYLLVKNWTQHFDLDEQIRKVGDSGRHQIILLFIGIIIQFVAASSIYAIGYTVPDPIFYCREAGDSINIFTRCQEELGCEYASQNPLNLTSLSQSYHTWAWEGSWTEEYSAYCNKKHLRTESKSLALAINTLTCWLLLSLADILGRKKSLIISSVFMLGGLLQSIILEGIFLKLSGVALAFGAEGAFCGLFTILINESSLKDTKLRSISIAATFIAYGLSNIYLSTVTMFIQGGELLMIIIFITVAIFTIPGMLLIVEAPVYLYKKGLITETICTLLKFAKINRRVLQKDEIYSILLENHEEFKISERKLRIKPKLENQERSCTNLSSLARVFCDFRLLHKLCVMTIQAGSIYCLFYGMSTDIQSLGLDNIHYNGITLGIMQVFGYLIMTFISYRIMRRTASITFQVFMLLGIGVLVLLSQFSKEDQYWMKILKIVTSTGLIATFMSMMFPLTFIYTAELFPAESRGTASAIIYSLGKLIGSTAPFLDSISKGFGMHVLVGCGAFLIISLPLAFTLEETASKSKRNTLKA